MTLCGIKLKAIPQWVHKLSFFVMKNYNFEISAGSFGGKWVNEAQKLYLE